MPPSFFTEVKISFLDFPNIPCKKTYIVIAIKIIAPSGRMMSPKAKIAPIKIHVYLLLRPFVINK